MLFSLYRLTITVIQLYEWVVILYCACSMLIGFGVIDRRNPTVWKINDFLSRLTEPVLSKIRSVIPLIGNVDLAPLVLLLGLQYLVTPLIARLFIGIATGSF